MDIENIFDIAMYLKLQDCNVQVFELQIYIVIDKVFIQQLFISLISMKYTQL